MDSFFTSAAALIITLGLLIAFHEYGHFWVARRMGVKVLRFSIGFGKPLWTKKAGRDQTEYVVAAIPLGGYVKMLDEREGEVPPEEVQRAFNRQPVRKRIAIVVAGPLFNFIFAIMAYFVMYLIGVPGVKPIVGEVTQASPAAQAGIAKGDEIIQVGTADTPTWNTVRMALLEQSLDSDRIVLQVKDTAGRVYDAPLDLQGISMEQKQQNLLSNLGMEPFRPAYPAIIGQLTQDGAAQRDGLRTGDRVVSVNGREVSLWEDWVDIVRNNPEQTLQVEIERDAMVEVIMLTPKRELTDQGEIGRIGAAPQVSEEMINQYRAVVSYGPIKALWTAVTETWRMSVLTLRMLGKMIVGEVSLENLSGPITIATYAGYTASIGLTTFLSFLAIVSISLGVLNLLPIPILDGGHLLVYVIEGVKGKALSEEIQARMQHVGMVILAMLMMLAFYNDIMRLIGE
ncbi:MAG: RIP metalloprotease RseP [Gammaproteobacteria bacterium SG8_11]|nr:MAG: RIP metalloprotease RseP [Gammaproteobacteria bacterium SG8_11]